MGFKVALSSFADETFQIKEFIEADARWSEESQVG